MLLVKVKTSMPHYEFNIYLKNFSALNNFRELSKVTDVIFVVVTAVNIMDAVFWDMTRVVW
jgi:hypothetical protein